MRLFEQLLLLQRHKLGLELSNAFFALLEVVSFS